MNWAVAVMTCPRATDYLPATLESVLKAGWLPDYIHRDDEKRGAWKSLLDSLRSLLALRPKSQAYMIVQDDILVARGCRDWLESHLGWFNDDIGVISLYTCDKIREKLPPTEGWHVLPKDWSCGRAAGALAVVLHPNFAKILAADPPGANAQHQADIWLSRGCKDAGYFWATHVPSLVRHVGVVSAIGNGRPWDGWRHEGSFWEECPQ